MMISIRFSDLCSAAPRGCRGQQSPALFVTEEFPCMEISIVLKTLHDFSKSSKVCVLTEINKAIQEILYDCG